MKPLLALMFLAAAAGPAAAGPDFISVTPTAKLAASEGRRPMLPTDDVVFENDSTALLSSGQEQVAIVARWMKNHPRESVVLEGHANSIGVAAYNEDLSARRARQVYATHDALPNIVRASLGRGKALSVTWTRNGVLFTETHGARPPETIATR